MTTPGGDGKPAHHLPTEIHMLFAMHEGLTLLALMSIGGLWSIWFFVVREKPEGKEQG